MSFIARNPFTKKVTKSIPFNTRVEISSKISTLHNYFETTKHNDVQYRKEKLQRLETAFSENKMELADRIASDMGKPVTFARVEVDRCIQSCEFYKNKIEEVCSGTSTSNKTGFRLKPMGIVHKIAPFNFPLVLMFKNIIPNLTIGNPCLVRPAQTVPNLAELLMEMNQKYDIKGLEYVLSAPTDLDFILSDPRVQGVSFTGSTEAGRKIAEIAGKNLKKSVLELGGMDPFVVLKDADLELASKLAVAGRLNNCGQVCISPKRFIVPNDKLDQFTQMVVDGCKNVKIGDPLKDDTQMGPISGLNIMAGIEEKVAKSKKYGDELAYGGEIYKEHDGFYMPTVFKLKDFDSPLWREEVFGPVFAIVGYSTEEEALKMANDSEYGLGAVVIGQNTKKADEFGSKIDSGMVYVNTLNSGTIELPFGGVKNSGYGREGYGVESFANVQTYGIS